MGAKRDPEALRIPLGFWPTPLQPLRRLGSELGVDLWIKRDDVSGLATGGNKVRKLEYLIGDAVAVGADCVITGGAPQSNHSRQTAAAAVVAGLGCHLALGGTAPERSEGNLLLDQLFGATLHWCGPHRRGERIEEIATELRAEGRRPYVIPYGGSDAVGARGFARAALEVGEQARALGLEFAEIVFASSSGGTHAGLICGCHRWGLHARLRGMAIDPQDPATTPGRVRAICGELGQPDVAVELDPVSLYGEYGEITAREVDAIRRLARTEGILLDPVYTGRAFAGLLQRIGEGAVRSPVLFWHTGGLPGLFTPTATERLG